VTVAVVDALELVEIDEQHCGGCTRSIRTIQRSLDSGNGRRSVENAGQRVVSCLMGKIRLEVVALDNRTGK